MEAMKQYDKETERALEKALGPPKYFIETEGKKEGERYFWFPTAGDSMTCNNAHSIPGGSLVLGRWLKINSIHEIPLHQPIVVIIEDNNRQYCLLKAACNIATVSGEDRICLHSYNARYDDFWLPFDCVRFLFVVERVRLSNGEEFIPEKIE